MLLILFNILFLLPVITACVVIVSRLTFPSLSSFSLAMTKPDRQLIAQVMLYSQGFRTAEVLASKIVPFFK